MLGFLPIEAFNDSLPIYFLLSEVTGVHRVLLEEVLTGRECAVQLRGRVMDALVGPSAGGHSPRFSPALWRTEGRQ